MARPEGGFPGFPVVGGQYEGQQSGGLQSGLGAALGSDLGRMSLGQITQPSPEQTLPMTPENAAIIRNKLFSTTEMQHLPHFVSFMKMFGVDLSKILPEGTGEMGAP